MTEPGLKVAPRRGHARAFAGRAVRMPQIPTWRGSTAQVQGLYPFMHGSPMPATGAFIGVDCIGGGVFSCHPLEWLRLRLISNPNLLITGVPGSGKSATIKALALRLMAYGVRTLVLGDLKNEYAPLARALGVDPVEIGPGLPGRLNPLDAGPLGERLPVEDEARWQRLEEIHRRRIGLVASLLELRVRRDLLPTEEAALSLAIAAAAHREAPIGGRHAQDSIAAAGALAGRSVRNPTIPQVWRLLRDPTEEMARELRVRGDSTSELREMIRPLADGLGNMVQGSLSGLFDGPTTVGLDFQAPIQTVDLSRLGSRGDETVAMTLACVSSWGQAAIDDPDGGVRLVVRDELWRAVRILAMLRKIDADLRLSRAQGTIQLLATHRLADFETAHTAADVAIAQNLIASCDVRICLRQDTRPLEMTRQAIGLTDTEARHIASWNAQHVGRALWKIGQRSSHVVQVSLHPIERRLFYTDERMGL